jgi:predicted nucleotidyltransferase component of viral defense system
MIPQNYITEWRQFAPWQQNAQVEQDFIISEALLKMYQNEMICKALAFRGGTALNKLFYLESVRYSEDIDLVQIYSEPFGPIFDEIKKVLGYLGKPKTKSAQHNNSLIYKIQSEDGHIIKLKIEVNTREHFSAFGFEKMKFKLETTWLNESTFITTYQLEELLATKLRALYQRRKGRDLFDLWYALEFLNFDVQKMIIAWKQFMAFENHTISQFEFRNNLEQKMESEQFLNDMTVLLKPNLNYNSSKALKIVLDKIISKI